MSSNDLNDRIGLSDPEDDDNLTSSDINDRADLTNNDDQILKNPKTIPKSKNPIHSQDPQGEDEESKGEDEEDEEEYNDEEDEEEEEFDPAEQHHEDDDEEDMEGDPIEEGDSQGGNPQIKDGQNEEEEDQEGEEGQEEEAGDQEEGNEEGEEEYDEEEEDGGDEEGEGDEEEEEEEDQEGEGAEHNEENDAQDAEEADDDEGHTQDDGEEGEEETEHLEENEENEQDEEGEPLEQEAEGDEEQEENQENDNAEDEAAHDKEGDDDDFEKNEQEAAYNEQEAKLQEMLENKQAKDNEEDEEDHEGEQGYEPKEEQVEQPVAEKKTAASRVNKDKQEFSGGSFGGNLSQPAKVSDKAIKSSESQGSKASLKKDEVATESQKKALAHPKIYDEIQEMTTPDASSKKKKKAPPKENEGRQETTETNDDQQADYYYVQRGRTPGNWQQDSPEKFLNLDLMKIKQSKLYQKFMKDAEEKGQNPLKRNMSPGPAGDYYAQQMNQYSSQQGARPRSVEHQLEPHFGGGTQQRGRSRDDQYQMRSGRHEQQQQQQQQPPRRSSPSPQYESMRNTMNNQQRQQRKMSPTPHEADSVEDYEHPQQSPLRYRGNDSFKGKTNEFSEIAGNSTQNLNLQASSKYVNFAASGNQQQMAQMAQQLNQGQGFNRMSSNNQQQQNYYQSLPFNFYQGSEVLQKAAEYNESTDIFLLRSKVQELSQNLARELESNKILDQKCKEYMSQLENSQYKLEDTKQKMFEQNSKNQDEIERLHNRIRTLNEESINKDRDLEEAQEELQTTKKKLHFEVNNKSRLVEENDDTQRRIDELNRLRREKEEYIAIKEEENSRLRKQADSDKDEIKYLKGIEERLTQNIKELNFVNTDLTSKNSELIKILEERDQKINLLEIENDNLQSQTSSANHSYRDMLSENDKLKKDLYNMKEDCLDFESNWKSADRTIEKMRIEINQLRAALAKTEDMLERERNSQSYGYDQQPEPLKKSFNSSFRSSYEDYEPVKKSTRNYPDYNKPQSRKASHTEFAHHDYQQQPPERAKKSRPRHAQEHDYRQFRASPDERKSSKERNDRSEEKDYSRFEARETYGHYDQAQKKKFEDREKDFQRQQKIKHVFGGENEEKKVPQQQQQYQQFQPHQKQQQKQYEPERDHRRSTPEKRVGGRSPDYVSKYESQFTKPSRKVNESHIVFGDPEMFNDKQKRRGPSNKRDQRNPIEQQDNYIPPQKKESNDFNSSKDRHNQSYEHHFLNSNKAKDLIFNGVGIGEDKQKQAQGNHQRRGSREYSPSKSAPFSTYDDAYKRKYKGKELPVKAVIHQNIERPSPGSMDPASRAEEIKHIENRLLSLQLEKNKLDTELTHIEREKVKTGALIKRKKEVDDGLKGLNTEISHAKIRLRDLNALNPY